MHPGSQMPTGTQVADLTLVFGVNMSPNVSPDPDCCRTMDPEMALGSSLSPDDNMTLGDSSIHPYLDGLCCGVTLQLQPSLSLCPRSQSSVLARVTTWATLFNTDPC